MNDSTYDTDNANGVRSYLKSYRYTANVADKFGFNRLGDRNGCNNR